jgi:T4-like virus Myoviridae tail sheath stabiliser
MLHFYDGQIRRYLTQIIRLMSNFSYKDADGDIKQIPVLYGDLTRQVASIIKDNSENKLPSVPRMAVYITGLEMDRTRTSDSSFVSKVHIRERAVDESGQEYLNTQGRNYTVERLMPSPYNLSVNVDIWSSNTDQKLQIVEQILTLFHPSLEIQTTDNFVDWTSLTVVNLDRIEFSNRSIPVGLESEIDIATLAFTTPIYISPPAKVKRLGVITNIITSIFTESQGNIDLGISTPTNLLDANNFEIVEERELTNVDGIAERIVDDGQFPNDGTGEMDIRVTRKIKPRQPGSTSMNSTWLSLGLYVIGNKAYVIDKGTIGSMNWDSLFDAYPGCYKPGISQIRILKDDGTYVVGYVTVNPLKPSELFVDWDSDTLPSNTVLPGPARNPNSYTSIDYIIDPLRWNPTTKLVAGLRVMLLGKIGNATNEDGAYGWKADDSPFGDLVAGENDIIEYDGSEWSIVFNSSESTDPIYITNLATGSQYKWTGEYWTKSYEGEFSQGGWMLFPEG